MESICLRSLAKMNVLEYLPTSTTSETFIEALIPRTYIPDSNRYRASAQDANVFQRHICSLVPECWVHPNTTSMSTSQNRV